jgi:hypothetical protein
MSFEQKSKNRLGFQSLQSVYLLVNKIDTCQLGKGRDASNVRFQHGD